MPQYTAWELKQSSYLIDVGVPHLGEESERGWGIGVIDRELDASLQNKTKTMVRSIRTQFDSCMLVYEVLQLNWLSFQLPKRLFSHLLQCLFWTKVWFQPPHPLVSFHTVLVFVCNRCSTRDVKIQSALFRNENMNINIKYESAAMHLHVKIHSYCGKK